mgnify:CR=1 FL=1
MQINGLTKTCGVIGNPVEHTLSPVIHNHLARLTGINMVYVPFKVESERVQEAIAGAYALGIQGLNVTVPHKEKVIACLKEVDALAGRIGAVNTLVPCMGGYKGYNTDMPGLYRAMVSDGISVDGGQVIILGAGGVARAVAVMLADKAEHIYILNRTVEKAQAIAKEVNGFANKEVVTAMPLDSYDKLPDGKYLAIQATNIGMHPHVEDVVLTDSAFYEKIHTGYDLIYNPGETKFMKLVKQQGGVAYNGLKMLLYQGIIAYELWNDMVISQVQAEEIYEKLKEKL